MNLQRTTTHGIIFFGLGLFLLSKSWFWGLLIGGIGLSKLLSGSKETSKQAKISHAAGRFGAKVPSDARLIRDVNKIYKLLDESKSRFPAISEEYDSLVEAMWMELSAAHGLQEKLDITKKLRNEWPKPWAEEEQPLDASLARAKAASQRWRDARTEAVGSI